MATYDKHQGVCGFESGSFVIAAQCRYRRYGLPNRFTIDIFEKRHKKMVNAEDIFKASLLVVDDSADNVYVLVEALRALGYQNITSTTEPQRVSALHAEHDFDLILLDMHMPGLNGLDVMRSLKEIEHEAYLPVLAITGDPEFEVKALKGGARDFLAKPYDFLQLEVRVHNLLEVRLLYKTVREQSRVQEQMAMHDALTGLPNRRLLLDRTEKSMQYAYRNHQRLAVMYIDLDGFKAVNDAYGHSYGDDLLRMVSERLTKAMRQEDTVSRMGGDEFVVLLSDISDINDIAGPATKILDAIARPFNINGATIEISASIGIATHPDDGCGNPESLIARADQALYEAKNAGKNRYHISEVPGSGRRGYWAGH